MKQSLSYRKKVTISPMSKFFAAMERVSMRPHLPVLRIRKRSNLCAWVNSERCGPHDTRYGKPKITYVLDVVVKKHIKDF